jgi:hypothetical protein
MWNNAFHFKWNGSFHLIISEITLFHLRKKNNQKWHRFGNALTVPFFPNETTCNFLVFSWLQLGFDHDSLPFMPSKKAKKHTTSLTCMCIICSTHKTQLWPSKMLQNLVWKWQPKHVWPKSQLWWRIEINLKRPRAMIMLLKKVLELSSLPITRET